MFHETIPMLSADLQPPVVRGAEPYASAIARGAGAPELLANLTGPFLLEPDMLGAAFDTAVLAFLSGQRALGMALQRQVLAQCQLFRVAGGKGGRRVLAIATPGDLQMNMPIEFITAHLDVQLDLLFILPDRPLPAVLPEHDVAFCVASDADPEALRRLSHLLRSWPRPVLNDPARMAAGRLEALSRDGIATLLADCAGLVAPPTARCSRAEVRALLASDRRIEDVLPRLAWPLLVRPAGSHAGALLERVDTPAALQAYLDRVPAPDLFLTCFVNYRSRDGLFRKYRVALIQGIPMLCHMAVSDHWMIHYLNAGMGDSVAKRDDEARAMASFDSIFARRHAEAFAALQDRLGMDYVLVDCAETPDGRLVLFEVEMAAIIHDLDPPQVYPYKRPQMQRVFAAFDAMLGEVA